MLVGILVDVSGSMQNVLQLNTRPTDGKITRIQSVFNTIMNIVKQEDKFKNDQKIFIGAFGLNDVPTCDLLSLLDYSSQFNLQQYENRGYEDLTELLRQNGAPFCGEYVRKYLKSSEAKFFAEFFSKNRQYLPDIVRRLPDNCKQPSLIVDSALTVNNWLSFLTPLPNYGERKSEEKSKEVIEYAKSLIRQHFLPKLKEFSKPRIKTFQSTADLLKRTAGKSSSSSSSFTSEQLSVIVSSLEPFIYGGTPMCQALSDALNIFKSSDDPDKILFLISDGESTDGDPTRFVQDFQQNNVVVFSCLLTSKNLSQPRRLYYQPENGWTKAQQQMFHLSSTVENSHSAMSILLEQNWELPSAGHSRLFIQGNHPDVIDEFSDLIQRFLQNSDILLNIVGRVSLDDYINAANSTFKPNKQIGGTCYAHAVSTVLHLAMRRIWGRENGVPNFKDLCQQLIDEFGKDGAVTENVLRIWTPKYRLHYKEINANDARQALNHRRPVVATFRLDEKQWTNFSMFYKNFPTGILDTQHIGNHDARLKIDGHAVVLIKCNPDCLIFMNSWGTGFADGGFFRVQNQSVLNMKFYDVYWTLNDLLPSEKAAFKNKCNEKGQEILQKLPESVKNLAYKCPRCHQCSSASKFIGHLLEAECPKCHQHFKPAIFGLNLY